MANILILTSTNVVKGYRVTIFAHLTKNADCALVETRRQSESIALLYCGIEQTTHILVRK